MTEAQLRKAYGNPNKPGRKDVDGDIWFVTDPFPTWYRYENGKLVVHPDAPTWE